MVNLKEEWEKHKVSGKIPEQLQNPEFRFNLLRKNDKAPLESEWTSKNNYKFNDKKLLEHIGGGGNYGIIGGFGNLVLVDADDEEINNKCKLLPETFKVKSCCPKEYKNHYYFIADKEMKPIRLSKIKVGDIGDIRSTGQYVVAPNSYAIDKKKGYEGFYKVVGNLPIANISEEFLKSIFKEYNSISSSNEKDSKLKKDYNIDTTKRMSDFTKNCRVPDYCLNNKMPENISKNWNLFPYVVDILNSRDVSPKLFEKLAEVQDHKISAVSGWLKTAKEGKLAKCSCKKMREYLKKYTPEIVEDICGYCPLYKKIKEEEEYKEKSEEIKKEGKYLFHKIGGMTDFLEMAKEFIKENPIYYDKNRIWWGWNIEDFKWFMIDDVDLINSLNDRTSNPSVSFKKDILESLKLTARRNKPKEPKESWVQFKNKIYDIESEESFDATPEYFITNPINFKLGESEETPTIDKLFVSWVGEEHKQELYEIISFCLVPNYFIHRMFCLIGSGSNGKSTYLRILEKIIGLESIASSSLNLLLKERFEGSKLLNKLVCLIGETNFNLISNTDFLKKLTGEDLVRCEFKGKDSFDFRNYAKLIMATNSLPPTADKTDGFYRRWKIIKFNNKFDKEKNVLNKIPEEEYNNLVFKCFNISKKLWKDRIFSNDGDFEERRKRYEDESNPLNKFIKENYEKDINGEILFSVFFQDFQSYLEERGARILSNSAVSKLLTNEGLTIKQLTKKGITGKYILELMDKNNPNNQNTPKVILKPYKKVSKKQGNSGNSSNSQREINISDTISPKEMLDFYTKQGLGEETKEILEESK